MINFARITGITIFHSDLGAPDIGDKAKTHGTRTATMEGMGGFSGHWR
jgi:hypothetical protein